jgi:pyruvate,water dikinase
MGKSYRLQRYNSPVSSPGAAPLFADIAERPAVGGKARSLARLTAAGLPVPAGFVVTDALFRALMAGAPALPAALDATALETLAAAAAHLEGAPFPEGFLAALAARLESLAAAAFSVRSSFAVEDRPGEVAAGVYQSRVKVTAADVPAALREVLRSALAPAAAAYALAAGQAVGGAPVAVLVHAHVEGDAAGGAACAPGVPAVIDARAGAPGAEAARRVREAAAALAAGSGPVELEWVARGPEVTFLQLRPWTPPPPPRPWRGWDDLPAGEAPAAWTWDAAHNPLPLSPAQAGLVAFVDARCRTGLRQRVLGGYLFWSPGGAPAPASIEPVAAPAALAALAAEVDRRLPAAVEAPLLEDALDLFAAIYEPLFGVVQPAARQGRSALADFLRARAPAALASLPSLLADVESRASERRRRAERLRAAPPAGRAAALAEYLAAFGDESPAWDVAVPTHGERPEALALASGAPADGDAGSWQTAAAAIAARLTPDDRARFAEALATARAAVAAGEDDDWLYARLQAALRRAILAVGSRLVAAGALASPDDALFLPFERLRALAGGAADAGDDLAGLAAAGRAACEAARRDPPPLAPGGAHPILRGAGTGGRALGRVVLRHGPRGATPPDDAVLVAASLLPTELPLLHVAAFVTETGGPLDHVATQARERHLPAVVGAAGATAQLRDGDLVLVDADEGLVVRC